MAKYEIPQELRYSRDDEWARLEDGRVTVGVTDYAQQQLGDIVFVELPEPGSSVEKGEPFGVIESVKAVSDLYAPVSGKVLEINHELGERPEAINEDCYGDGWMLAIAAESAEDIDELLDAAAYQKHVAERSKE